MLESDRFLQRQREVLFSRLARYPGAEAVDLCDGLNLSAHHAIAARIALGEEPFPHHLCHSDQLYTLWAACNVLGIFASMEERLCETSQHRADLFGLAGRGAFLVELKTGTAQPAAVTQVIGYADRCGSAPACVIVAGSFNAKTVEAALRSGVACYTGDAFIRSVLVPLADRHWTHFAKGVAA